MANATSERERKKKRKVKKELFICFNSFRNFFLKKETVSKKGRFVRHSTIFHPFIGSVAAK